MDDIFLAGICFLAFLIAAFFFLSLNPSKSLLKVQTDIWRSRPCSWGKLSLKWKQKEKLKHVLEEGSTAPSLDGTVLNKRTSGVDFLGTRINVSMQCPQEAINSQLLCTAHPFERLPFYKWSELITGSPHWAVCKQPFSFTRVLHQGYSVPYPNDCRSQGKMSHL